MSKRIYLLPASISMAVFAGLIGLYNHAKRTIWERVIPPNSDPNYWYWYRMSINYDVPYMELLIVLGALALFVCCLLIVKRDWDNSWIGSQ